MGMISAVAVTGVVFFGGTRYANAGGQHGASLSMTSGNSACSLCTGCGGSWPEDQGLFDAAVLTNHVATLGESCSGYDTTFHNQISFRLCCKTDGLDAVTASLVSTRVTVTQLQ